MFHNAAKNTPEALPMILDFLKTEGYSAVPVSRLIYTENFKIDNNGMQIQNNSSPTDTFDKNENTQPSLNSLHYKKREKQLTSLLRSE